jgi:hypothetical protein
MKFTSILKNVILEQSRIELLFDALTKPSKNKEGKTIKPKLTNDEFVTLVNADPTTRTNNVDMLNADAKELGKVKAGKYVQWLIKNYLTPVTETQPGDSGYDREVKRYKEVFIEDLFKVKDDLTKFERFKNRLPEDLRDINKLTPSSLYDAVKDFDLTIASTSKSERKTAPVHPGSKLVFDGPTWRVVEIKDKGEIGKEAACFYGGNYKETRWCTSSPGLTYFNTYIKDGPLYVVYKPSDTDISPETGLPKERYQFHFPSDQFMDKDDRRIDLVKYLTGPMAELKDFFKPEFAKGLTLNNGTKLSIDSFNSGSVGKFVGLYGLDELINNLPEDLTEFVIQIKDNNGIIINIPESIDRFKNLTILSLVNCIDRIPDSVCNLSKLRFLSLPNNKKLTSVPGCIINIPSLYFLNLKECPNVEVPDIIKSNGNDMGAGMWDLSVNKL